MRKFLKAFILTVLLVTVVIPSAVYVVVSTPWAQEQLRLIACKQLTELLGTEVCIDRVEFQPFNTVTVSGLRVKDDYGATALSAARIGARFELFHFLRNGILDFDYLLIDGLRVDLYKASPDVPLNIQNIISKLSNKKDDENKSDLRMSVGTIVMRYGVFNYDIKSVTDTVGHHFTPAHIHIDDINLRAGIERGGPDGWLVNVDRLTLHEKSGIEIINLKLRGEVSPRTLALERFDLSLPGSHLQLKPIRLNINGYSSVSKVIATRSIILATPEPAVLSTSDFEPLAPILKGIDRVLYLDFSIDAAMRETNVSRFIVNDDAGDKLELTGQLSRLDEPDSMSFNIVRLDLTAPAHGTASILGRVNERVAQAIGRVGDIVIHGSGEGDMTHSRLDFIAHARGASVSFNGRVNTSDNYRSFGFNGHVGIKNLDVGKIVDNSDFGLLDATLVGKGTVAPHNCIVDGNLAIDGLQFMDHNYSNIEITGSYDQAGSTILADIESNDPLALFGMNVRTTNTDEVKSISIGGNIESLNLAALSLPGRKGYALSSLIDITLTGETVDDLEAYAGFRNICYKDTTSAPGLHVDSLTVNLTQSIKGDLLRITSDYLNGTVEGSIVPSTLIPAIKNLVADIVPDVLEPTDISYEGEDNNFTMQLTLSNAEDLSKFFKLPVIIIYPVDITASFDAGNRQVSFTLDAPFLQQGDKIIDSTVLGGGIDGADKRSLVYATTHMPTKKGPMTAVVGITGSENRFDTRVNWELERKIPLNGAFNFSTLLGRDDEGSLCITTDFNPGHITLGDNLWAMERSTISWCNGLLTVDGFTLHSDTQRIEIDGRASATPADTLSVVLQDVSLVPIFETLEIDKALIGGRASGHFKATEAFSKFPRLATDDLHVDSIGYNYCVLGDADVKARWDNDRQSFFIDADIINPEGQHSQIWGDIFPMGEALDLNFDANHVRVGFMKPFMAAFTSDVKGYVSGKARLFGTFKDIDLEGDVYAEDLQLKIDFTNTWYTANDSIHVSPGLINLNDIVIKDVNGHTALLNGWLRHDYFHFPVFEFNITDAQDFLSYNVNSKLNPDWWGTIYGNGSAMVKGRPGVVEIGVEMSTAPGSTFTFVLSDRLDAEQYSFITFNDRTEVAAEESLLTIDDIPEAVKEYQARQAAGQVEESSAYLMTIRMDITPAAELNIIMDPIGGDYIKARGSGDMTMDYNSTDNSLGMRGTYTLDEGMYHFTLQDIIIKDFTIEPGSSIAFKGDPYEAELNLQAAYSINANLSDLDKSFTEDRELNRTNVPVQALLNVKGDMRQPDIDFDLRFPTLTSDTYRKVRSIISTEDMMSRQIIYLLALNRFYTPDYMESTTKGNEIFSVASSTITSQISSMLGKLSDKWSIAPNLRSDRGDFSDVEVDVALSSRLLNNRLLLNGNFGYRDKSLNTNQFIGDFDAEYLLTPAGTWRLRAYNRYNDQNYYLRQAATTQGVGIMFKRDFDSLFRRHNRRDTAPADSTDTQLTDTITSQPNN